MSLCDALYSDHAAITRFMLQPETAQSRNVADTKQANGDYVNIAKCLRGAGDASNCSVLRSRKSIDGLRARAVRGSVLTVAGLAGAQLIKLASSMALTRLLFPEAFGVMALVGVYMQGLAMFSDVGIGPSIVRSEHGDEPTFLNTAWSVQVARGVLLWLGACGLAYPVATLYDNPLLLDVLPIAGLTSVIAGFNSTRMFTASRHLALGRLTVMEFSSQLVGTIGVVTLAWWFESIWSLVFGSLIGESVKLLLSHTVLPGIVNRFCWDRAALASLLGFGKWIFVGTMITFVGQQFDRLYLGTVVSPAELGVYSIAVTIATVFTQSNMQLIRRIALPSLAQVYREAPVRMNVVYDRVRRVNDMVFLPVLAVAAVFAQESMGMLYDARYASAGFMLQVLIVGAAIKCVLEPAEICLVAIGQPRWATARYAMRTATSIGGVIIGWKAIGIEGVLIAVAVSEVPALVLLYYALAKARVFRPRRELAALLICLTVGTGAWLIKLTVRGYFESL